METTPTTTTSAVHEDLALALDEARATIEQLRAAERSRTEEAERAAERAAEREALMSRMTEAMDGRAFVHPRLTDLVLDDFRQALSAPANAGRSDREVFDLVTEGQGYFANQHPPMPQMAIPGHVTDVAEGMEKLRAVMGIID